MPNFKCNIINSQGKVDIIFISAPSLEDARVKLLESSCSNQIKIRRYYWSGLKSFYLKFFPYLPKTQNTLLTVITNRLNFGTSLDKIFLDLSSSYKDYRVREVCKKIYISILHGKSLTSIFEKYPLLFPRDLHSLLKNIAQENNLSSSLSQYTTLKNIKKSIFFKIFIKLLPKLILLLLLFLGINYLVEHEMKEGIDVAEFLDIKVPYSIISYIYYFNFIKYFVLPL